MNWLIAYPWQFFEDELPEGFEETVASVLLRLPVNEPVPFEPFADQIIQKMGWVWREQEGDHVRRNILALIERTVVKPLKDFGILTTHREKHASLYMEIQRLVSFSVTDFGQTLLKEIGKIS